MVQYKVARKMTTRHLCEVYMQVLLPVKDSSFPCIFRCVKQSQIWNECSW